MFASMTTAGKYVDVWQSMYSRIGNGWIGQEALTMYDNNFQLQPLGAESWSVSEDGLTWTFKIRKGLEFSDGTPITARDWEWTIKWGLSTPGYDFAWFFFDIKNAADVAGGKKPADELGVRAIDDYTLEITTEKPAPYFPGIAASLYVSPRHAFEKYGEFYSVDPKTYVSSGPFILTKLEKGKEMVWEINKNYKGVNKPYLSKIVWLEPPMAYLPPYEAGEVDMVIGLYTVPFTPGELARINATPELRAQAHPAPDFVTYYLGFNTIDEEWKPFHDIRVRQAIAHAIDRDTLINTIMPGVAIPAYSMLMAGFPGSAPERYKDITRYDPALAKKLLAEAGYPDGKGFPKVELWLRDPSPSVKSLAEGIQAQLKSNLGIEITLKPVDYKTFTANLKHGMAMYIVPYGFDYFDQSNLLGIWKSSGRHPWADPDWDKAFDEAASFMGDPKVRDEMFYEVERSLVEKMPAVFLFHPIAFSMWKPWIKGPDLSPNKAGIIQLYSVQSHSYTGIYVAKH
jgi:ABC-type transport system substrate-binding protein